MDRAEILKGVEDRMKAGQMLEAWEKAKAYKMDQLESPKEINVGARLMDALGAPRSASWWHWRNYQRFPENEEAYLYHLFSLTPLGPIKALTKVEDRLASDVEMTERHRADLLAFLALELATLRDFEKAHLHMDAALELRPDDAWIHLSRGSIFMGQDEPQEALACRKIALEKRPTYIQAILGYARVLAALNRDDEAIALVEQKREELSHADLPLYISMIYSERDEIDKGFEALEDFERLSPLIEDKLKKWLQKRKSDFYYLKGDHKMFVELTKDLEKGFHQNIANYFVKERKEIPGKRVRLAVPYVRQDNLTCGPATLDSIGQFFGREGAHHEIAEEICYHGTKGYAEREWTLENGYFAKEFRVTWDSARTLLDLGIPFALGTHEVTSAHLQAVIGYDESLGIFLVRDPGSKHYSEYFASLIVKDYAFIGPRGLVFVPMDRKAELEQLELPDEALYDLMFEIDRSLNEHDRDRAETAFQKLIKLAPNHTLTLGAERVIANYDGDNIRRESVVDKLLELHPDSQALAYSKLRSMAGNSSLEEQITLIREQLKKESPDPIFYLELGIRYAERTDTYKDALFYLQRALVRDPSKGETIYEMAGVYWSMREREWSTRLYRFAACLEERAEYASNSYFSAANIIQKHDEALKFLQRRFELHGAKSSLPALTLLSALRKLDRDEEGLALLEEAIEKRPDDGDLLLRASQEFFYLGKREKGRQLLERAKGKCSESSWMRKAARQADSLGDREEALRLWQEILKLDPIALDAHQEIAQLIGKAEGVGAAIEFIKKSCERFPKSLSLHEFHATWLKEDGPEGSAEPVLLHILELDPNNGWARRELVLLYLELNDLEKAGEATRAMLDHLPDYTYSQSIASYYYHANGEREKALEHAHLALELSVDNTSAVDSMYRGSRNTEERQQELEFFERQIMEQTSTGKAIGKFQDVAFGVIEHKALLEKLQAIRVKLPEFWQSYSSILHQLLYMDRLDEALEIGKEYTEKFPLTPVAWRDLSRVYSAMGDTESEIAMLEKALEINPDWMNALRQLAAAHANVGDFESQVHILRRAMSRDPLVSLNHGELAAALWREEETREEAFEIIVNVVRYDPGYEDAWNKLFNWGRHLEKRDVVIEEAKRNAESRPRDPDSWENLSTAYRVFSDYEESLKALDSGLEVNPRSGTLHDLRAVTLARLDRFDEAVDACNPPIYDGDPPVNLMGRSAWVLYLQGRHDEAIQKMQQVADGEPDYLWAQRQLADWYDEREDYKNCLKASRELVRLDPEDAVAHGYLGACLLELEEKEQAKKEFEKSYLLSRTYSYGGVMWFNTALDLKDYESAREALDRLTIHDPGRHIPMRELKLAARQEQKDKAISYLKALCEMQPEEDDEYVLPHTYHVLKEAEYLDEALAVFRDAVEAHEELDPEVGWFWVQAEVDCDRSGIEESIRNLKHEDRRVERAWVCLLRSIEKKQSAPKAVELVERNSEVFKANDTLWGWAGYLYVGERDYKKGIPWVRGWENREGLEGWMLSNVADIVCNEKGLDACMKVHKHAVEHCDDRDGYHSVTLALFSAWKEDWDEVDSITDGIRMAEDDASYISQVLLDAINMARHGESSGKIQKHLSGYFKSSKKTLDYDERLRFRRTRRFLRKKYPFSWLTVYLYLFT